MKDLSVAGRVTSQTLADINPLYSVACSGKSAWFPLFPFKHSECCGSVDRLSTPALAGWLAGWLGTGWGGERESLLEEKGKRIGGWGHKLHEGQCVDKLC